jgi:hypothetical protein
MLAYFCIFLSTPVVSKNYKARDLLCFTHSLCTTNLSANFVTSEGKQYENQVLTDFQQLNPSSSSMATIHHFLLIRNFF